MNPNNPITTIRSAGTPANTLRAYASDLRYFWAWAWLAHSQKTAYPIDPALVELFVIEHYDGLAADLDRQLVACGAKKSPGGLRAATIRRRLKALTWAHQARDLPTPAKTERLRAILRAYRKREISAGIKPRQSKAIVKSILLDMIAAIDKRDLAGKRNAAILEFGFFFGGRRREEIAGARVKFLERAPWGAMRYHLHHSKTDQMGKGLDIEVKARNTKNLKRWLKATAIQSGPLFPLIDAHTTRIRRRPIYPELVNNIVKYCAGALGLDPADYSAHGLRRGFITECGRQNIGIERAMEMSGHSDYKTALIYYEQGKMMNNPATDL